MIEHDIQRRGADILLGISVGNAVLDLVTDLDLLEDGLDLLRHHKNGLDFTKLGRFGDFEVTLTVHSDDQASIFIDGPTFIEGRDLSAAICLSVADMISTLEKAMRNGQQDASGNARKNSRP